MTDMPDNYRRPNDKLNRLIKDSRETNKEFVRPGDTTIDAYVYGLPTQSQKREIRDAMLASESFRREIVALCEEAHNLRSNETRHLFDKADVDELPADLMICATESRSQDPMRTGLSQNWILSLAAAAIVIIASVIVLNQSDTTVVNTDLPTSDSSSNAARDDGNLAQRAAATLLSQPVTLRLHTAKVEKALLVRASQLRGASPKSEFGTSTEAALGSFAQSLKLDDNGNFLIELSTENDSLFQTSERQTQRIIVMSPEDDSTEIQFEIPRAATTVTLWTLSLPQLSLHSTDIVVTPELSVSHPSIESMSTLFTITYSYGNQIRAADAQQVQK